MKVLCLLPALGDARIARRIDMLSRGGFDVRAAAFERHHGFGRRPNCPVTRLGKLPPRKYLARAPRLLLATRRVRAAMRDSDVVYAFNPDLALLGILAGVGLNRPLALDVADVKALQVASGWAGSATRAIEKRTVRRCRLLTLTTEGYRAYYRDWLGATAPIVVIENKLDPAFVESSLAHQRRGAADDAADLARGNAAPALRLGWFGRLRDEWTLQVLERLIAKQPKRFGALLAGTPSPFLAGFSRRVAANPRIEYRGGYSHPADLPALYGSVDIAMACYPPEVPHGWSQSNRYYEACLFRKPLVVREGCADAANVRKHGLGLVVEASGADEAAAAIARISPSQLARWRGNASALPVGLYSALGESEVIFTALREIAN